MRLLLLLLFLLPGLAMASPFDRVRLVSQSAAPANGVVQLALDFQLQPGWHIYWSNPGDAGFAPTVTAAAPVVLSGLKFPAPELFVQGPITDYVLSGHVVLPFTAAHVGSSLAVAAQWLVCSDICVPEHGSFTLAFPTQATAFAVPEIPASPFAASIAPDGTLSLAGPGAAQVAAAHFFPAGPGMMVNGAPQKLAFTAAGVTLHLSLLQNGPPLAGIVELTDPSGTMQALAITPSPGAAPANPPFLLLAFLGGLILNLMPCVFPILALKAVGIARLGARPRAEALGYTAGVLAAMGVLAGALLALRAAGVAAGWGFQFQYPGFVAVVAWLIFALALNLAGVFEFPAVLTGLPARHSFATGALAVAVATPCTAPFMGAAVAAALSAPVMTALGIFLALGLGLAAPFLLLALIPGLARWMPRPGGWMLTLQRFLSLPMAATFIWLAWVLQRQAGMAGLGLLLTGAGFLVFTLRRAPPFALVVLLLVPLVHGQAGATLTLPGAQPYSAARLAALRSDNTPVFIDLTAAWCVTCLVNEASTLKNPSVQAAFAAHHVVVLVGDWTQRDPGITALLDENHRDGVPLYLYYAPGAAAPVMLPQVLDPGVVKDVIKGR
jgi:thiol:disulfide interchange protein DsbD